MPRDMSARDNERRARAKRQAALERIEFKYPSAPRRSAAGVTSLAIKAEDPAIRRMIDEALARRQA
mgnify:CR=1 FL=1